MARKFCIPPHASQKNCCLAFVQVIRVVLDLLAGKFARIILEILCNEAKGPYCSWNTFSTVRHRSLSSIRSSNIRLVWFKATKWHTSMWKPWIPEHHYLLSECPDYMAISRRNCTGMKSNQLWSNDEGQLHVLWSCRKSICLQGFVTWQQSCWNETSTVPSIKD